MSKLKKGLQYNISGSNRQCNTCFGYGLWGIGDPAPMGEADAADGLPTKPCSECGADANPKK